MSQQTLVLKLAGIEDTLAIIELAEELFDNSVYRKISTFDRVYVQKTFLESLEMKQEEVCTMLLMSGDATVGFLSASKSGVLFHPEDKLAIELGFWIKPEYRNYSSIKLLMSAYFYWAKLVGCKAVLIGKLKGKESPEQYIVRRI